MRITNGKDNEIMGLLRSDRTVGFRMLFDTYYMPLCLFSVQMTDDFDASEDIVQGFFVRFWEEKMHEKLNVNLRSYLFTSVRNNTLMYLRKSGRIINLSIGEDIKDDEAFSTLLYEDSTEEELREKEQELYASLQKLSPGEREALERVVVNEMTYKQASEDLGISVNTIKTQLRRAMRKLRGEHIALLLLGMTLK